MKRKTENDSLLAYTGRPHLELVGNTRCLVDGLQGISEYTADKIKMSLGKYAVCFYGDGLYINSFSPAGAIIEGTIVSVEFESNA
ncbi:MAG: YabP/YqfC family sporulation protein [Eubacterium sp.]|nr:YabP/YqfC family sporulation protein [Eubacterium sp.]